MIQTAPDLRIEEEAVPLLESCGCPVCSKVLEGRRIDGSTWYGWLVAHELGLGVGGELRPRDEFLVVRYGDCFFFENPDSGGRRTLEDMGLEPAGLSAWFDAEVCRWVRV